MGRGRPGNRAGAPCRARGARAPRPIRGWRPIAGRPARSQAPRERAGRPWPRRRQLSGARPLRAMTCILPAGPGSGGRRRRRREAAVGPHRPPSPAPAPLPNDPRQHAGPRSLRRAPSPEWWGPACRSDPPVGAWKRGRGGRGPARPRPRPRGARPSRPARPAPCAPRRPGPAPAPQRGASAVASQIGPYSLGRGRWGGRGRAGRLPRPAGA
jgi:hypothetical protein